MEAANKGAVQGNGVSVGLGIELPFEQGMNQWVDLGINFRYFFARKTMFVKYAQGFIVLPGRPGDPGRTLRGHGPGPDPQGDVLPDRAAGHGLLGPDDGMDPDTLVAEGMVSEEDLDLIHVVDDRPRGGTGGGGSRTGIRRT